MARVLQVVERNEADKGYRFLNLIIDFGFSVVIIWVLVFLFVFAQYLITGNNMEEAIDDITMAEVWVN
ncbi:hypothetical protein QGN23_13310 [Chryseobacterium gotjawalense]|uniref:RDD family protein n=1 Tax=Chryseobacterium gotjawalense TaxID=3042315 RepID=A0ABY8RBN9_9FLAO|nr:hypothetical protein [Chryseobacterium sp. wdc7]WHF51386.1 hypothetical protein QGN23_13310 [Chryseobacterium sp. wdc7]